MSITRIWILGAADPEMEAIDRLLREAGERVIYALGPDAQRVRPADAYRVAALSESLPAGSVVYRVECDGPAIPSYAVVIDHHRPGDPGYGRPPAEFLPASSIGQVIQSLGRSRVIGRGWGIPMPRIVWEEVGRGRGWLGMPGRLVYHRAEWRAEWVMTGEPDGGPHPQSGWSVRVPHEYVLVAAADHCLAAAYRGECPGVDPDALMRWRAESRAAFQRRPVEEVLADVERAREALRDAPTVRLSPEPWEPTCGVHGRTGACWQSGGADPSIRTDACYAAGDPLAVADMRGLPIPELPEAAAREGVCFIASLTERDGRVKVVCQSGTPEQIEAFMHVWAPAQGLTGIYGDPARGFAGGYAT